MDAIVKFVLEHRWALIIGVVLGLALGLLYAWQINPVEWGNATPSHLRSDFQRNYILWVAERYASDGDLDEARTRLGVEFWEEGELAETLAGLEGKLSGQEVIRLRALAQALGGAPETPAETPVSPPVEPEPSGGILGSVGAVCGVVLLVACAGGFIFLINRRRKQRAGPEAVERGVGVARGPVPSEEVAWGEEGPPLVQFVTTYELGDDHYDPSFSIELESGEFMGECGVGVSETIGVGTPNQVTAFEVWLFDKSDIRTVTKVLMSDYAFHDEALKAKLAPKGEPMLAEAGKDITLETKTLRVCARIVEASYSGAGSLPSNSFFEKVTVELATWVIPEQEGTQPAVEVDAPVMPPTL
ncbi:MAG: hypothetical protein SXV54_05265 [Chloroflexota bacterium]|nr:hypothetical protein [Chloroflexota bacterium]